MDGCECWSISPMRFYWSSLWGLLYGCSLEIALVLSLSFSFSLSIFLSLYLSLSLFFLFLSSYSFSLLSPFKVSLSLSLTIMIPTASLEKSSILIFENDEKFYLQSIKTNFIFSKSKRKFNNVLNLF